MGKPKDNDIHDRHSVPSAGTSDTTKAQDKVSQGGIYSEVTQERRDAHFHENGVGADGRGGVPPESEQ